MPSTTERKTKDTGSATPIEAQLAKIRELCEAKGIEPPEPTTSDQAVEIIAALTDEQPEPEPAPEPQPEPDEAEAAEEEEKNAKAAEARAADERSDKQTQAMFDRAVTAFKAKLCDVFGVEDLQPAGTPGVIGFLLPGFTEQKTHDNFIRCQTCNGYGDVLTGSMKEGNQTQSCPGCGGRGFLEKLTPATTPTPPAFQPPPVVTGPTTFPQAPSNGQPEYGIPSYMGDPNLTPGA